jgi:hypothetical protein
MAIAFANRSAVWMDRKVQIYNLVFINSILGLFCESVQLQAMLGFGLPA